MQPDVSKTIADLDRLKAINTEAMKLAMLDTVKYAALFVRGELQGPRPSRLISKHGLTNRIGFDVEQSGKLTIGYIGTNIKSEKGFNYPEWWEVRAHAWKRENRHASVSPRPFLKPAVINNKESIQSKFQRRYEIHFKELSKGIAK